MDCAAIVAEVDSNNKRVQELASVSGGENPRISGAFVLRSVNIH
jgi:hypothetical protein